MIKTSEVGALKIMAEMQCELIHGGVIYLYIEGNRITWDKTSTTFGLDIFKKGKTVGENSLSLRAVREKREIRETVPASVYGTLLEAIALPVVDENNNAVAAFTMVFPKQHKVVAAFQEFAPIMSKMFPEGVFLYVTDTHKVIHRQPSEKFDMPAINVGYEIKSTDIAARTISSCKPTIVEVDPAKYGVPVLVTNSPLMHEGELVGTFGICIPKSTAAKLRDISEDMTNNISQISAAVEELCASATNINGNQKNLNEHIEEIQGMSDEIGKMTEFIKNIADQTRMLGLNASIESARAGEAGRGFGIVAKEISKLSIQSNETVPQIRRMADQIKAKVEEISGISHVSIIASEEQAAATEEITASVEEIVTMAEKVNHIAKNV